MHDNKLIVKYLVPKLTKRQYQKCVEFVNERKWKNWAVRRVYKSNSIVLNIEITNPEDEKQFGTVTICVEEWQVVDQLLVTTQQGE